MNIKSLLIGSAAALVAVTGARAADAVMAPEPEPVEYVRVCDAYGAGFFYIPGTETCLQISGYVWYQIGASSFDNYAFGAAGAAVPGADTPAYIGGAFAADGWMKNVRARVNFDARSETEWGTLRSYIRLQASGSGFNADLGTAADQAYIELGGLKMGYSESFWVANGKAGPLSIFGSHSWGGMNYGYQQRALIGYSFASNGFAAAISLEDDALNSFGATAANAVFGGAASPAYAGQGDYIPDVVAAVGYGAGWGAVWAKVGYDSDRTNSFSTIVGAPQVGDDGWGAQLGVQINMPNMPGSSFRLIGYYADSDNMYGVGSSSWASLFNGLYGAPTSTIAAGTNGSSEWSVLASYNQQFSATFGMSAGVQWFNNFYAPGTDISTGLDGWGAELSAVWFPVSQFEVRAELHYDKIDTFSGTTSGYLRFTRYF